MPDEKVQVASRNWAPRFTSQGVDYNDLVRTTARINSWDDWCREWCATGHLHSALARRAEAQGNRVTAGEAYIAAALCYHFGKFLFQDYHDEYMAAGRQSIQAYARGLALLDPHAERLEIPFDGEMLVGILRRPAGVDRPPLILLLPGLDSVKEEFFYWEEVFLRRGLATLTLEGPGQGECGYELHIRPDYEVAVSTLLDALTNRSDLDLSRVGVAGVSLGGYYAVRAAAFDSRIKAAVENSGPWNLGECWEQTPGLTRAAFQYHSGAADEHQAEQRAWQLALETAAPRVQQPLLVIHGQLDRVIPIEQAKKIAAAVGTNAELRLFENGNHVCNNIPYIYRPLTADWLVEKLG